MTETGHRLAEAIAKKDAGALHGLLRADVDFLGLTPRKLWEAHSPAEVADILFANWFDDGDEVKSLVGVETGQVGSRISVRYRLLVANAGGEYDVEQQAYFDEEDGQVGYLRVLCSGFVLRESA